MANHERHSHPSRVVFELYLDVVPKTCHNFLQLLLGEFVSKEGKPLQYKGTKIHRVWKDGFIQGGDVDNENGKGGQSIHGKYFEDENYVVKHDKPGILGMSNVGRKHTNNSQFYITMAPLKAYDNRYVAFGRVISGFRTIRFINRAPAYNTKPSYDIVIHDCGIYSYSLSKLNKEN